MPSTPQPDFVLERASLADADELAPIFFSAFYSEPYYVAMCPETPACTASWAQTWIHAMNDPATHAMKVTDRKTGKIAAAGKWISPKKESGEKQPGNEENRWADLPAHCDEELANGLFGSFAENRRGFMADRPHYYMEFLQTREEYKGKGAGSMILKYGCDMADRDGLECYIDATPTGRPLYERFGWEFTKMQKMPRFDYWQSYGIRKPQKQ